MAKNHILRSYTHLPDGQLGDLALHVAASMDGNGNFTNPPVPPAALQAQAEGFNAAVAACVNGTPADTLNKNTLGDALITTLDTLANYVELAAGNDAQKMLSSGFALASTSRSQAAPGMTAITAVTNVASGKLGLELHTADNAWAYIVEYTAQPGGAVKTSTFTSPRGVTLTGLTPGAMYSIRAQVMGSANQTTDWCDSIQHMST